MIKCLERYCQKWNLHVNLDKSKIVIFSNGGKLARNERWWYNGKRIEVVNEYKYLGVILTSKLSFYKHFEAKVASAQLAMNSLNNITFNNEMPFSSKMQIFNAVRKSMVSCGAQIWEAKSYNALEVFQKFFIKTTLRLPLYTPDHILYLETHILPLLINTVRIHLAYKNRCLKLKDDRYPNFFA